MKPLLCFSLITATVHAAATEPALAIFDKSCTLCLSNSDEDSTLTAGINHTSLLGNVNPVKAIIGRGQQADEAKGRMTKRKCKEGDLAYQAPLSATDAAVLPPWAKGEVLKSFGEADLRVASQRGTKGLQVEVTNSQGKVIGQHSAPTFTARAVFTVGPQ